MFFLKSAIVHLTDSPVKGKTEEILTDFLRLIHLFLTERLLAVLVLVAVLIFVLILVLGIVLSVVLGTVTVLIIHLKSSFFY